MKISTFWKGEVGVKGVCEEQGKTYRAVLIRCAFMSRVVSFATTLVLVQKETPIRAPAPMRRLYMGLTRKNAADRRLVQFIRIRKSAP